jgi:FkbM family methyltransferase
MVENIHLFKAGRGTYYDRNINIITWTDQYEVKVGRYCSIGRDVTFFLHANHRPDWVTTSSLLLGPVTPEINANLAKRGHPACKGDIVIGNDVWIGSGATIMSGVHIGDGAVIAAKSFVTRNVKPYSIVGGNPAEFLCFRFDSETIEKLREIKWWDMPEERVRELSNMLWSSDVKGFIEATSGKASDKIRIVKIDDDDRRIFLVNDTSEKIDVTVRVIETYTGLIQHTAELDVHPGIEYWVWTPFPWKDREFIISNRNTDEVLATVKPVNDNLSVKSLDRKGYLKKLAKVEQNYGHRLAICGLLGEHFYQRSYARIMDVEKGDVVVDVGFNFGLFSLGALTRGASEIHAFEPNKNILSKIRPIYPDRDGKVTINECAVSDSYKMMTLYEDIGTVGSSVSKKPHDTISSYNVQCINLYEYIKANIRKPIDFLKVDCEGEEYRIFDSIPDVYFSTIKKVIVEFHNNTGPEVRSLIDKFERTGFDWQYEVNTSAASELGLMYASKKKSKKESDANQ